jgi:MFS family permease
LPASESSDSAGLLAVVRSRHVPRLLASALLGRLPTGMAALALVLLVRERGGGYAFAGLLAAVYAGGVAIGGPLLARVADWTRQGPALVGGALTSAAGFGMLAGFGPDRAGPAVFGAAVAGLATPPLEPCLRALWPSVLPGRAALHSAFALDAALQEILFVAAPLLVLAGVAVAGPGGGVLAAGLFGVVGAVAFATTEPSRAWRATTVARHWAGPLRSAPLRRLLLATVLVGATVGSFNVTITAYSESAGSRSFAGWLIAANAFGALVSGLLYSTRPPAANPSLRLTLLVAALALGYAPLALTPSPAQMAPLAMISGMALPPLLTCVFILVDLLAPRGTVTEAFAWVVTAFLIGSSAGSAAAGALAQHADPVTAFLAGAGYSALAALVVVRPVGPGRHRAGGEVSRLPGPADERQ